MRARVQLLLLLFFAVGSAAVSARPVSYVGGWTFIEESNRQSTAALIHYTPSPSWSLGLRNEWVRDADYAITSLQPTYLLKRWFGQKYQANVYLQGGLGLASGTSGNPMSNSSDCRCHRRLGDPKIFLGLQRSVC